MPGWAVIPSIRTTDLPGTATFYTETLGFSVRRGAPDEGNMSLIRGDASVMIEAPGTFYGPAYNEAIRARVSTPGATALYIEASDLDELYGRVQAAGARVVDPLGDRPWGQAEFTVEDPAGNWLTFWKAAEQSS